MPEGRFVSRSISTSGQLKRVSFEADYLFGRCIPHLDRDGRLDGDPDVVKAVVCPLRSEMTPEMIGICLAELDTVGLLEWYEVDGQQVLWFPNFREHQQGMKPERERPSRLPSHEAQGAKKCRRTSSGLTPDPIRTNSPQVKSSKGKSSKEKLSISESGDSGAASWVAEGVEWWGANVGEVKHARFGAALKNPVANHGWPLVFTALQCYVEDTKSRGKPPKPEWFAGEIVRWLEWASMPATDDSGLLTPRGRAIMGVA